MQLFQQACEVAAKYAAEYVRRHNLTAPTDALSESVIANVRVQLPQAIQDAKDAAEIGMRDVASSTFAASMALAGIKAAKEFV